MRSLTILLALAATMQGDAPRRQGKTSLEWLAQLQAPDAGLRIRACQALGDFGRQGQGGVPALGKALASSEADVRFAAADALRRIGPLARDAFTSLLKAAKEDDDKSVRCAAIRALGAIGPQAKGAVPVLAALAEERDGDIALAAFEALAGIGSTTADSKDALRRAIRSGSTPVRLAALRAWADTVPDSSADRDVLIPALADPDKEVKLAALQAWPRAGVSTSASLEAALRLFADPDVEIRRAAVGALAPGPLAPVETRITDALPSRLLDSDGQVRVTAVTGLAKRTAWSEFGPVCTVEDAAFAVLVQALKDADPQVRFAAASAMRVFSRRDDAQVVDALEALLQDASMAVRRAAAVTLLTGERGNGKALAVLVSQLRHHDDNVRSEAAQAFSIIGTRAKSEMAALLVPLEDRSPMVRQHVTRALGALALGLEESEYKHVIAELTAQLDDKAVLVRIAAAVALVQARASAPKAVTLLRQHLRDADPAVRLTTLRMVSSSPHIPKELDVAFEDLLEESIPEVRRLAAAVMRRKE
jgi:HEAT repeat protein